jgi:hypothetical protein
MYGEASRKLPTHIRLVRRLRIYGGLKVRQALTYVGWLDVAFSPRSLGFNPGKLHARFVADEDELHEFSLIV